MREGPSEERLYKRVAAETRKESASEGDVTRRHPRDVPREPRVMKTSRFRKEELSRARPRQPTRERQHRPQGRKGPTAETDGIGEHGDSKAIEYRGRSWTRSRRQNRHWSKCMQSTTVTELRGPRGISNLSTRANSAVGFRPGLCVNMTTRRHTWRVLGSVRK